MPSTNRLSIIVDANTDKASGEMKQLAGDLKKVDQANDNLGASQNRLAAATTKAKLSFTEIASAVSLVQQGLQLAGQAYDATVGKTLAYAEQVRTLGRTIGATAEETSKLIQAADDTNVSFETLSGAMEIAIRKGVRPSIEGMGDLADEYLSIQDPIARTKFLMDKFGKSGADLAPLMEKGSKGIRELGDAAEDVGLVMSGEAVQAARDYEIALDDLSDTFQGLAVQAGSTLIPALTDGLTKMQQYDMALSALGEAHDAGLLTYGEVVKAHYEINLGFRTSADVLAEVNTKLAEHEAGLAGDAHAVAAAAREQGQANIALEIANAAMHTSIQATSDVAHGYANMGAAANDTTPLVQALTDVSINYRDVTYDIVSAHEALIGKQQTWADGAGSAAIAALDKLGLEGEEYLRALLLIDQAHGTSFANDETKKKKLEDLTAGYLAGTVSEQKYAHELRVLSYDTMPSAIAAFEKASAVSVGLSQDLGENADKLRALNGMTAEVTINEHRNTYYRDHYLDAYREATGGGVDGDRAVGGPVVGGKTYRVGERGEEMFVTLRGGYILNHEDAMAIAMAAAGAQTAPAAAAPSSGTNFNVTANYAYQSERTLTQDLRLLARLAPEGPVNVALIEGDTVYELSELGVAWIEVVDGLGLPPILRLAERGPNQHGETDLGYRLQPRNIDLILGMQADEVALWARRQQLLARFRPRAGRLVMRFTLDDGSVRQIEGHPTGDPLTLTRDGIMGDYQPAAVTLRCGDPLFYNPNMHLVTFGGATGGTPLTFPVVFPIKFGASSFLTEMSITYAGTYREYPVVQIRGPITDARVVNLTTGDELYFQGYTIPEGSTYIIDTRYSAKSVVDDLGLRRIHELSDASDLATFSLEADPDVPSGINVFSISGINTTGVTQVYIQYFDRYIGI